MLSFFQRNKATMVSAENALKGRETAMPIAESHLVLSHPMQGPWPQGFEVIIMAMGCFWGAERRLWQQDGVYSTSVGYAGGFTKNPTYEEVCSGQTGHTEVVQVVFDPTKTSLERLLKVFWESHDPTQGMRQGNDVGTQYRSAVYTTTDQQLPVVQASAQAYAAELANAGLPPVTTEIGPLDTYYFAEDYHQQYLAKNPGGYCGLAGTGVSCPVGILPTSDASS